MAETKNNIKAQARDILNGKIKSGSRQETLLLIEDLKANGKFSYAAMLTKQLLEETPNDNNLLLNLSLCIYKDNDLPSAIKYDKALEELAKVKPAKNSKQECAKYAQYGAIYKRLWQTEGNSQYLDTSLLNYRNGYLLWLEAIKTEGECGGKMYSEPNNAANDNGYNAINYAYCLDLLAQVKSNDEAFGIIDYQAIEKLIEDASEVRNQIIRHYLGFDSNDFSEEKANTALDSWSSSLKGNEWIYGTLGESFFGGKNYDAAQFFYVLLKDKMMRNGIMSGSQEANEWKIAVTAQQLYGLATIQSHRESEKFSTTVDVIAKTESLAKKQRDVLSVLINNPAEFGDMSLPDKVGIGLSGGGFRAALYHIGVLARLAELDMLRQMEVISCVSGGSIIGTFYYLKLKKLLETKPDDVITKDDYIKLVQEIEVEFLNVVQKNIRQEVFTNIYANIKMGFHKHYSRTHRLGELYEEYFYAPLLGMTSPIAITNLMITPADSYNADGSVVPMNNFKIKHDNWYRKNKIPILVLNATSLNTGHNWQFTAKWMGEPPANMQPEVDMKSRLRRVDYDKAPGDYKQFRLGYAVASSSCVPGLFAALPMPNLYPDVDLKLVDGGVHDNQGISSLIEQECRFVIVSDASGQLAEESTIISAGPLYTINRTNLILQERIRENEFLEVSTRFRSSQLSDLKFMHLRKFLYTAPKSCYGNDEPLHFLSAGVDMNTRNTNTAYGIDPKIQDLISKLRTDLDAFSDQEAYALMYSGYQMTKYEFLNGKTRRDSEAAQWRFFSIASDMDAQTTSNEKFPEVLKIGSLVFGKVLEISRLVKIGSYLFASLVIVLFTTFYFDLYEASWSGIKTYIAGSWKQILFYVIGIALLLTLFFSKKVKNIVNLPRFLEGIVLATFTGFVLGPLINFYMFFFNRIYLKYGEVIKKWWK